MWFLWLLHFFCAAHRMAKQIPRRSQGGSSHPRPIGKNAGGWTRGTDSGATGCGHTADDAPTDATA